MKARLHHVGIAVHDLDVSQPIYEKLYGTTMRRAGEAISGPSGIAVAACWRVGIELTSPIAGSETPTAVALREFLATRGEGVYALAHAVEDFDAANAAAEGIGLPLIMRLSLTPEEIDRELGGAFEYFDETVFNGAKAPGIGHFVAFNSLKFKARG